MTWTVTKENGAVSISDWLAEEAADVHPEQLALVQAFRCHPPISLKLTIAAGSDPFECELGAADPAAPRRRALFLGQSHSLYEDLLNRLAMMILVIDGRGRIESTNQAVGDVLGYLPEEIIGRRALSLLTGTSRRTLLKGVLRQFFAAGKCANVDVACITKSGGVAHLRMSAVGHRNGEGRIERSIAVFADLQGSPRS